MNYLHNIWQVQLLVKLFLVDCTDMFKPAKFDQIQPFEQLHDFSRCLG